MDSDTTEHNSPPKGTQRTLGWVGHRTLLTLIRDYSTRIQRESICLVFYLQGRGGLGKTRFLQDYVALARVANTPTRVCRVIDLVNPEKRKLVVLEQRLIEGLKSGISEQGIPADEVVTAFSAYFQARDIFTLSLQYDEKRRAEAEIRRIEIFITSWNMLSARYPLVIRFDTLEHLFVQDVPATALPRRPEARSGVEVIQRWLFKVLPQLHHTLVLFSGRPPTHLADDAPIEDHIANPFIQQLQECGLLLPEGFQILQPLLDPGDIVQYLQNYHVNTNGRIAYIQQITEGSPLLLSLYAECQRPDPPTLVDVPLDHVATRLQFERQLIDTILNPLRYVAPEGAQLDERDRPRAHEKLVLTFCLYILNYARRGLRADELAALLRVIDPQLVLTQTLLDELRREVLVKTLSEWDDNGASEDRLFLHDAIWQLIDESGLPRDLGLEQLVLDELCHVSRKRVAQISQTDETLALLRAMADHVTYELTRDFGQGYRFYLVYMDQLLGQRKHEDALVLADMFWRLLTLTVVRPGGPVRLYHDLLAEAHTVDFTTVERHDQLHYIKLLRAQETYPQAVSQADALYRQLAADKVVPALETLWLAERPDNVAPATHEDDIPAPLPVGVATPLHPRDPYLFADLVLAWANVLTWAATPDDYERRVEQICGVLIALLNNPTALNQMLREARTQEPTLACDDNLLRLRRTYLLGQAYHIRDLLLRQRQDYDRAIADASAAVRAFQAYAEQSITLDESDQAIIPAHYLNDNIRDDLVFVQHNLALTFAENGNFGWALRISDTLIQDYVPKVSAYLQTLIHNTRALIHLRQGDYTRAQEALQLAEQAAQGTTIQRAIGLISWTKAQIERWRMNRIECTPQPAIDDLYDRAAQRLAEEGENWRDVLHDRARFLRDLAFWYGEVGDQLAQADYCGKALRLLDDAIEWLPLGQRAMQRAELLETKASILNDMARYAEARALLDEIDQLMQVRMPWYGQVVCCRLALQRAYLWLADPARRDQQQALREAAIGLARAYVFGRRHRDQAASERLIRLWIDKLVPIEQLAPFVRTIEREPFYVRREELPYQQPRLRRWTEGWDASVAFFSDFLVERQLCDLLAEAKQELGRPTAEQDQAALRSRLAQAEALAQQQLDESVQAGRLPSEPLQQLHQQAEQLRRTLDEAR